VIGYPAWYQGGQPDVERVMRDLFAALLPSVSVVSWLPPDYAAQLTDGIAFLRVFRMGGRLNIENRNWVDETRVQVAALTATRDDSWALIEFVRQVLYAYRDGGNVSVSSNGSTAFIEVPGEVVGPQLIPEAMRDERLVPVTFDVYTDRPRGLPNYRKELGLNSP
jgi:hypothetical protein